MASVATAAGNFVLALSACGAIYALCANFVLWRFLRGAQPALLSAPSVTVLKPLHGDEPELYQNLSSLCGQDYPGPVQVVMGARDADDPALAVAEQVRQNHSNLDITVIADPAQHGTNRKISSLINMSAQARGEVIVISDSASRRGTSSHRRVRSEPIIRLSASAWTSRMAKRSMKTSKPRVENLVRTAPIRARGRKWVIRLPA